uniref:Uncharacterized protein n=1 Tax=Cyanoderma ruficeps TaxID=181631 RepID=A0A8C3QHA6_9PASS
MIHIEEPQDAELGKCQAFHAQGEDDEELSKARREEFFNPGINYLDPSTSAFANSIWHSSTRWVNHRHQSYEAEFVYREVQVVRIKLEALRELIIRQSQVAESCNTPNPHLL